MKKRLLITSIVMMLVVAVALSTATYAWFTTNANVQAEAVVLTAAASDGEAILITHNMNGNGASNAISLTAQGNSLLYPATPLTNDFFSNGVETSDFKNLIVKGGGTYVDPEISTPNVSFYTDTFYIFNKGASTVSLTPTVTIRYDAANGAAVMAAKSARIAILERTAPEQTLGTNGTYSETYSLKGIWEFGTTDTPYYAYTIAGSYAENTDYYDANGDKISSITDSATFGSYEGAKYTREDSSEYTYVQAASYVEGTTYYTKSVNNNVATFAEASSINSSAAFTAAGTLYTRAFKYVVATAWDENATYYTRSNTNVYTLNDSVTSETFAAAGTLYVRADVEVTNKNTAAEIAYATDVYGAVAGTVSGTYVKPTTSGAVTFSKTAFTPIAAPTSGNQIANEYTVVVWLEGWDLDCTNAITSGLFSVDVSFDASNN